MVERAVEPVCAACITIPALTVIELEFLAAVGSKLSKSGDLFPIKLAKPIVIDGREVVPAGVTGMGEVVHAKKSGGSGAAGELVLAARYLDVDGRRLTLRSMHVALSGQSKVNTVNAINTASAASPLPVALIGFLIKGGQTTIAQGTIAEAKTAAAFTLTLPRPEGPASVEPTAQAVHNGGE